MSETPLPLRVQGLKAGYGSQAVLNGVDMDVKAGEIRVVLGGSGCGKSTLLKNATGLERPWEGKVELFGKALDWSQGRPPDSCFEKIGVLFQGGALLSSMPVGENVSLALRVRHPGLPITSLRELARIKLSQVKLAEAADKFPGELSGGMRKRAALARALAADPELLFCDEPSAGLDPVTSRGLDDLLLELRDDLGLTIVVVTHELDSIRALGGRITFLSGGKVLFDGALADAESGPEEVRDFLSRKPSHQPTSAQTALAFAFED